MKNRIDAVQRTALTLFSAAAASPAWAASGTNNVNTLFTTILTTMQDVSSIIATIAFVYAGIKILFIQAPLREVAGPIIGGVVIGAAGWLASLLVS
ncbi:TrbC/VirB2 family protein [Mesosutterella sp. OilRF-GAM-744-9]|uniref:TrbC/VirB2 family protein n=1 Tax=Mesosutterella porci TaxID=2915351 RepID=A0ABS9MNX6_9BURK|nr:TrbC/VirB2 family protein [Mesosutterella sp. oilRF-744-WT-GAM-9]MCG5030082.1 TrbC/VirB2 family protein [Mesosutterella sp. oilRF-744-WT-GAM-9]